ncbi:hypothetical protein NQ317_010266 [Molorchus minor]|uniref:Uncharacterized protein n=1 Tax=Molorchus minor TaxID=1323400 RepID=A0ABQ9JFY7_9CUCU|nr:hypothetical protein NQ317_010266 [Molorchus minor]
MPIPLFLFQRIESLYGVTELACWLIRIIISVIELVLIQSLYTMWKDEELVGKRLRDLNMAILPIPAESMPPLNSQYYQNNGYDHSTEHIDSNLSRYWNINLVYASHLILHVHVKYIKNNITTDDGILPRISMDLHRIYGVALWPNNLGPLSFDGYQFYTSQSEFNASIFMPNFINSDMLTGETEVGEKSSHHFQPWMSQAITETSSEIIPNYRLSPDVKTTPPRLTKCASVDAINEINRDSPCHQTPNSYLNAILTPHEYHSEESLSGIMNGSRKFKVCPYCPSVIGGPSKFTVMNEEGPNEKASLAVGAILNPK